MSTKHTGNLVNSGKMHYTTKQHIIKPDVIVDYNATMGGMDNLSRVIDPYSCQRKSLKWYRKLAELFIDISVSNSYIVWKELNSSTETHLNFKQMIIKEIITWHSYGSSSNKCGPHVHDQPLRLVEKHIIPKMSQVPKKQKTKCVCCHLLGVRRETCYQCEKLWQYCIMCRTML